jgi:hypothetical protein
MGASIGMEAGFVNAKRGKKSEVRNPKSEKMDVQGAFPALHRFGFRASDFGFSGVKRRPCVSHGWRERMLR